ncbi:MAG: YdcF family protein [Pseudomonadota bacterium]
MFALIRWVLSLGILAMWCALIGTGLYIAMYEPPAEPPTAEVIVVLGGNGSTDGTLTGETAERMTHGLELFEADAAPLLAVTGGGEPSVGFDMANAALSAGVPEEVLVVEEASLSTLQNALFLADFEQLDKTAPILLVSHRYHLPRAWASFRWAGFQDVSLSAADPDAGLTFDQRLLWETVKWPYNVLRAAAASAAMAGDVPRESWLQYLE